MSLARIAVVGRIRPHISLCGAGRCFSSGADPRPASPDGRAKRLSDQAKASQNLWDMMVPEKNMGVTHPFFLVLLGLTLSLHFYNNKRDAEEDAALRKKRLDRSASSEHPWTRFFQI